MMKPEEAIKILEVAKAECEWNAPLEYQAAFDAAIKVLEKQVPKKPIKSIDVYNESLYRLDCPACGNCIAYGNSRVGTLHKLTMAPDRCGYCGQAVDFSEWEEKKDDN